MFGFFIDTDSDTIPNRIECREWVPWSLEPCIDTDSDGYQDVIDMDSDGDGVKDFLERGTGWWWTQLSDTDDDGIRNFRDIDDDNDGIITLREDVNQDSDYADDTDLDGIPNFLDADDDNDFVLTCREIGRCGDDDMAGRYSVPPFLFIDGNNNKIPNYLDVSELYVLSDLPEDEQGILGKKEDDSALFATHQKSLCEGCSPLTLSPQAPVIVDDSMYRRENEDYVIIEEPKEGSVVLSLGGDFRETDTLLEDNNEDNQILPAQQRGDAKSNQDDDSAPVGGNSVDTMIAIDTWSLADSDGDGVPNGIECQVVDNCDDGDSDGLTNDRDTDSDGDSLSDTYEYSDGRDSDGDVVLDFIDTDDDGDGVLTRDEDTDANGSILNDDSDADGVVYYLDAVDDSYTGPHRCSHPWGGYPLSHGDSLVAYKTEIVSYPDTCLSEERDCAYGTLGGSFSFASCYQMGNECYAPDGQVFPHDSIATYYVYDIVTGHPENGVDLCPREARLCVNGERHTLDGVFQGFGAYIYPVCSAVVP